MVTRLWLWVALTLVIGAAAGLTTLNILQNTIPKGNSQVIWRANRPHWFNIVNGSW